MTVTMTTNFPEHRKKKVLEAVQEDVLLEFLRDFHRSLRDDDIPHSWEEDFIKINSDKIASERATMQALINMADMARTMLGQPVAPQDKPSVGPKAAKIVATPTEPVTDEEVDPVLQSIIDQEAVGSALEPIEERIVEHKNRKETVTSLGTRLAPP